MTMDFSDKYLTDHPHRGLAVIINNRHFLRPEWPERRGTDLDALKLHHVFEDLGFEIRLYQDQTERGIRGILAEASRYDHEQSDCFLFIILTHGEEGIVYATDEEIPLRQVFEPFTDEQCPSLSGKPRLFFLQACQGVKLDEGVDWIDGEKPEESPIGRGIPVIPEFLIVSSTVPGYYSWRNNVRGSWFCQAICDVFRQHGETLDVLSLMTRVNRKVAFDFQSISSIPEIHGKKQIPCVTSMLTKDLYFTRKKTTRILV